jgi:predicted nucleic acid-binding protein
MNLVLDCSSMISLLLSDEEPTTQIDFSIYQIHVPSIFMIECMNAMLIATKRKRVTQIDCDNALEKLFQSPFAIIANTSHLCEITKLSTDHSLTAYDASYLELALRIDAKLATLDKALAKAARDSGIEVIA